MRPLSSEMATPPSFKTVHASVRPARVAILVDKSDQNWEDTCLRAIEFFSQLWGGAYNIIVPTDGKSIDERFWTILEAFDPDNVYAYRKSGEDIRLSRPEEFQRVVDSHVSSWVTQFGNQALEQTKKQIEKDLTGAWASDFGITSGLQDEIKVRLSPFYFQESIVEAGAVSARSAVPFALTSLAKIIRNTEHPDRFATVNAPADLLPRLWYSAACGRLRDKTVEELEAAGLIQDRFDFEDDGIGQLIEFVINGEIQGPWVVHANTRTFMQLNGIAPFQLSMLQLGLYRPAKYPAWAEPMVLVAGRTVGDFCLYYCLSRLRERVAWVLPSATEKALSSAPPPASRCEISFINRLHNQKVSQQSQGGLAVTSFSLADAELEAVMAWLNSSPFGPTQIAKAKDVKHLVRMPLVAIERDNLQRDIPVQMSDDLTISPFNTPKPKNFRFIDPREHRYVAQLSVAGESPPKHFHLGKWVIADHRLETKQARVGKDGPAYFCPNIMYFGGDIDTVLVRPHLRLPPLQKILIELARTQGYECRPSDKGIYADETIAKWGGLDEVARFLQGGTNRSLLDMFLDRSESGAGKGVYLTDDRRRYLDFIAITTHVGKDAGKLIDQLISKQILYRGFIFRCQYCRNSTWFSISEITQEFKCRRCGRGQVYTKTHWKVPDEPAWFYKLDELVYQGYRQGMVVSLLALNYLRLESSENFSFVTDREFWSPEATKADAEIDLFCVSDGVLTIGEAKKENRLGATMSAENAAVAKYKRMAAGLSARRLVLATFSESWSPITIERVASAFSDMPQVAVQFLNAAHLHLS
jgi:hypothetical protein